MLRRATVDFHQSRTGAFTYDGRTTLVVASVDRGARTVGVAIPVSG
jgi:hypothetical protein